jgi:hypothetical protein
MHKAPIDPWFGRSHWLRRCRGGNTTSRSRVWSYSRPSALLMVNYGVRPTRRSLCSEGGLSELFLIILQRIPSGDPVCLSLQQQIPTGASNFSKWGCGHGYTYFLSRGSPVSNYTRMEPIYWSFSCSLLMAATWGYDRDSSHLLDACRHLDFLTVCVLLPAWASRKSIGIFVLPALMVPRMKLRSYWRGIQLPVSLASLARSRRY